MAGMTLQQAMVVAMQHHKEGKLREAEELYRQILQSQPDNADALHLLGVLAADTGRDAEGVQLIREAIKVCPLDMKCWSNLWVILLKQARADEAVHALEQAARLTPDEAGVLDHLGMALQAAGRGPDAIKAYLKALSIRDRSSGVGLATPTQSELCACDNLLVTLHHDPANHARAIFQVHDQWNRLYGASLAGAAGLHDNDRTVDRRLRVGYVSAYLNNWPVGRFMLPLIANHDRGQFEISCYSDVRNPDALTEKLRSYSDTWRDTPNLNDEQLARLVHRDRIDILIDLGMHQLGNRMFVFARKPAPVQVT
jgi:protein O-GlcNAc transferase